MQRRPRLRLESSVPRLSPPAYDRQSPATAYKRQSARRKSGTGGETGNLRGQEVTFLACFGAAWQVAACLLWRT